MMVSENPRRARRCDQCTYCRARARLGLARAYALQGDAAKSYAAYQGFFALWKDADPDIPSPHAGQR